MNKLLIIFFVVCQAICFGGTFSMEKDLIVYNFQDFISGKLDVDKNKVLVAGAVLAGAYFLDEDIQEYAKRYPDSEGFEILKDKFNDLGSKKVAIVPVSLYACGAIIRDEKLKAASVTSLESGAAATVVTIALKGLIGRTRPDEERGAYKYNPFSIDDSQNSFPSGHSTAAWAVFTPYAIYYDAPWIYLIPAGVSAARVVSNRHWTSDVIAGGIIGYTIGYSLAKSGERFLEIRGNSFTVRF